MKSTQLEAWACEKFEYRFVRVSLILIIAMTTLRDD